MQGIIFVGAQASGKSSFYMERFYSTHIRLNMDMLKTRHREKILLTACLMAKQPVVLDNTNPNIEARARYLEQLKEAKFETVGYYFSSKIQDCLARNAQRTEAERVPEAGVKGTFSKLVLPSFNEGFDFLYYVTLDDTGFKIEEWQDEL